VSLSWSEVGACLHRALSSILCLLLCWFFVWLGQLSECCGVAVSVAFRCDFPRVTAVVEPLEFSSNVTSLWLWCRGGGLPRHNRAFCFSSGITQHLPFWPAVLVDRASSPSFRAGAFDQPVSARGLQLVVGPAGTANS